MGRRLIVALLAGLLLVAAANAAGPSDGARYLETRQQPDGGFAEPGGASTPGLTAWAVLGLRAAGRTARGLEGAGAYLARTEGELETATDVEIALLARVALGDPAPSLVRRLREMERESGLIGST